MPRPSVFANAHLLDPEAPAPQPGSLLVANGRIAARLAPGEPAPIDAETVDLRGAPLAPGLIDLHLHGALVFAGPEGIAAALRSDSLSAVRHGTTAFLATTVAWSAERLPRVLTQLAACMTQALPGAQAIGIHLEGPWINPGAAGAQPAGGIRPYDPAEGEDLLARGDGCVKLVTLAPEVEGASKLLDALGRRGIVAALGHSLGEEALLTRAVASGVSHVTHLFNAMGPMRHREPGVAGFALSEERLTCDLICDGVHVHPRVVRVAARALGTRLVLITDRMDAPPGGGATTTGLSEFGSGPVREVDGAWRLADGRLAASSLQLDRAVRNAVEFAGLTQLDAIAACTLRPARLLGIESQRGTLRVGARADFAIFDAAGAVAETWIAGRRAYAAADPSP